MKLFKIIFCALLPFTTLAQVVPVGFVVKAVAPIILPPDGPIITTGLLVNLDANNTTSYPGTGTTWTDLSGNANHATLQNGVSFSTGNNGGYLGFDGVNDIVQSINLSSYVNFTIEIWLYDTRSAGERDILTYNGIAGSYLFNGTTFRTDGDNLGARTYSSVGQPPLNTWYRFCITKSANLYINQTKYTGSGNDRSYGILSLGDSRINNRLNGRIALVKIYDRALTDLEIQQNFNASKARFGL